MLPFRPFESIDELFLFGSWTKDHTVSPFALWQQVRAGKVWLVLPLALAFGTQVISIVTTLLFITFPLSALARQPRPRDWAALTQFGLWLFAGGFTAGYALVHLEPRHIAPILPVIVYLAAVHGHKLAARLPDSRVKAGSHSNASSQG
jgi:hypothetical protein